MTHLTQRALDAVLSIEDPWSLLFLQRQKRSRDESRVHAAGRVFPLLLFFLPPSLPTSMHPPLKQEMTHNEG